MSFATYRESLPSSKRRRRRRGAIVRETREAGIARANQECCPGDLTIAARVLGSGGRPVSAVNLAGPNSRRSLDRVRREVGPEVSQVAALVRRGKDPPRGFDSTETADLDSKSERLCSSDNR